MVYELNHFGIVVRDLAESLLFYESRFSARTVFRGFIPSTKTDVVYLQIGGSLIELLHPANPEPDEQFGITHIAFLTRELEREYADLVSAGYVGLLSPRVAGTGVGRLAFVQGPDGERVELLERDFQMRVPFLNGDAVAAFEHYAIATQNHAASLEFYRGRLGLEPVADTDLFRIGGETLRIRPSDSPREPVLSHVAVRVRDASADSVVFDPDGVAIELLSSQ